MAQLVARGLCCDGRQFVGVLLHLCDGCHGVLDTLAAGEREAVYLNESVFRAGRQGVEDAVTAIAKVQQHAHELTAVAT